MTSSNDILDKIEIAEDGGVSIATLHGELVHWNMYVPGSTNSRRRTVKYLRSSRASKVFERQSGVYRLVALDEKNEPMHISRVCGTDETGTLYIGREGYNFAVRSRVSQLVNSLTRRSRHEAGVRLLRRNCLAKQFPIDRLAVEWFCNAKPDYAESVLFDSYIASFGELPPLNHRQH